MTEIIHRIIVVLLGWSLLATSACVSTYAPPSPIGQNFPIVSAKSLTGSEVALPAHFAGKPVLLLVGYVQNSQFDVDRWMLGLKQLNTPVSIAEIPAAQGLFPRMISSRIDEGMRSGIPEADWKIVFTVYRDAEKIASFLGNTKPRNVRAVLLDAAGKVLWFHDQGFSPDKALELDALVRSLSTR